MHKCVVFGIFSACMPEELTMKKDVAASAAEAVAPKKPEFSLIDEDLLKSRIYTIRGVKVMLDADLAEIYGYSTKAFNQQVKNNIERFAEDFRFQLSKKEVEELRSKNLTAITSVNDAEILRCKNCTTNISTMSRSNPFVFTEQGIYMLMTVLKGDLAVQQSMALIRLFKQMKDYIARSRPSCNWRISPGIAHCSKGCCERGNKGAHPYTTQGGIFELRLRIRLLTVVRFPCAFRHLHIRKSSREAGIFRAACIYAKPNFSGSFEHVANPHLRILHPVSRTFYAVVIFAPAEPIPHGFYICRNRSRRPV